MRLRSCAGPLLLLATVVFALPVRAAWQVVATEQGKRVEIDRDSVQFNPNGESSGVGRIVLDKPIVDPKTGASYRIIEVQNRYFCNERTYATLKRTYYKEEGEQLRQEEMKNPFDMPVRSGTPDDKLLREVCRPKVSGTGVGAASRTVEKVADVSADLRKANQALLDKTVPKDPHKAAPAAAATAKPEAAHASPAKPVTKPAELAEKIPAVPPAVAPAKSDAVLASPAKAVAKPVEHAEKVPVPAPVVVATAPHRKPPSGRPAGRAAHNETAPASEKASSVIGDLSTCTTGRLQSPIDLSNGIAVDLEPLQFFYRPAVYRVTDMGRHLQITVFGGGFSLLGKTYRLMQVVFHQPSELTVDGKAYPMDAQLIHQSDDGRPAIVSVFFEIGREHPVLQAALNHLPLEPGGDVMPPGQDIDLTQLLPEDRRYHAFMGSQTSPPCTEGVLWLALKKPQQLSAEQLSIFRRLYGNNARPVQPTNGRVVKESR